MTPTSYHPVGGWEVFRSRPIITISRCLADSSSAFQTICSRWLVSDLAVVGSVGCKASSSPLLFFTRTREWLIFLCSEPGALLFCRNRRSNDDEGGEHHFHQWRAAPKSPMDANRSSATFTTEARPCSRLTSVQPLAHRHRPHIGMLWMPQIAQKLIAGTTRSNRSTQKCVMFTHYCIFSRPH